MLRIDVLAEKPRADAAHEICNSFDGRFPKGLINGGIVDDADQIAELLTIPASGRRRGRLRNPPQA